MRPCFIAALLFVSTLGTAFAQSWEKINPTGVVAIDWLAVDSKDVVTITGGGGTYWTADQGKTWTGGNSLKAPVKIQYKGADAVGNMRLAFVAHPDGDLFTLQMVIQGGKLVLTVFQSTDHGFNWANTMDSLPLAAPYATANLLCSPNGHLFLFVANPGALLNNLFVSTDKGKTWEKKGDLVNHSQCVIDPDNQLYCAGYKAGGNKIQLFVSKNDGATWDSLFADNRIAGLAANQKGSVAVAFGNSVAAKFLGDSNVKTGIASLVDGAVTAMAIAPDNSILLGSPYSGIQKIDPSMNTLSKLNNGLGTDTSATPRQMVYDSKGNLFMRASQDLFLLKGSNAGVRFQVLNMQSRAISGGERRFDAAGRRSPASAVRPWWHVFFSNR